jgi:hypothetical protein
VNRRRRVVAACIAVVALGGLSSCSSQPSNRRVVSDVIESQQLPPAQEACMLERLETYTDDQLDDIANENENWNPAGDSMMEQASASMQLFIADYAECTGEGGAAPASSQPAGSSEPSVSQPSASSEPTVSSAPSVTSEPAPTTS